MNYDVVEVVIDKLISTFGLKEWQYDIEEMVEHIAEAVKLIGASKVYATQTVEIEVHGRLAKLPRDCENIKYLIPEHTPYRENLNFLEVDQEDGSTIVLCYQAIPMDARGYILVPDSAPVREAIMWYLAKILILRGDIKSVQLGFADQEWHWRCKSARGYLNAMSQQEVNGAYNDFVRLNPLKDQHYKGYVQTGQPSTLHRDKNNDRATYNRGN